MNHFGKYWKVGIILAIIVPLCIFAFEFSNILSRPIVVSEKTTLETVEWQRERPNELSNIPGSRFLDLSKNMTELSFREVLSLGDYDPNWFGNGPSVYIGIVNFTVSLSQGFVESVNVNFTDGYLPAAATFYRDTAPPNGSGIQLSGLQISSVSDTLNSGQLAQNSKFCLKMVRVDENRAVSISNGAVLYEFKSPSNYTHQIDITNEIVYFNGTVYKSVTEPVRFVFGPDDNDTPKCAEQIEANGLGREFYIGFEDVRDFYKVQLTAGDKIQITENQISLPLLYLFAPNDTVTPVASSTNETGTSTRSLEYTATFSGWWYIEVDSNGSAGIYSLTVTKID